MRKIKEEYDIRCNSHGDINEHMPTLYKYATECDHITEMGVRSVGSAWAFFNAYPKKYIGYDIDYVVSITEAEEVCKEAGIDFVFKQEDTSTAVIEQTDLLFIDTWHVYEQLKKELERHHSRVNKYIIMHDTHAYGFKNAKDLPHQKPPLIKKVGEPVGLWAAVEEFLEAHREWSIKEHFKNNNGLTVLERKDRRE